LANFDGDVVSDFDEDDVLQINGILLAQSNLVFDATNNVLTIVGSSGTEASVTYSDLPSDPEFTVTQSGGNSFISLEGSTPPPLPSRVGDGIVNGTQGDDVITPGFADAAGNAVITDVEGNTMTLLGVDRRDLDLLDFIIPETNAVADDMGVFL